MTSEMGRQMTSPADDYCTLRVRDEALHEVRSGACDRSNYDLIYIGNMIVLDIITCFLRELQAYLLSNNERFQERNGE